jgi:hypothetical protein
MYTGWNGGNMDYWRLERDHGPLRGRLPWDHLSMNCNPIGVDGMDLIDW